MSTTVLAPSGLEISSNTDDAATMMHVLAKPEKDRVPRILRENGVEVKPDAEGGEEADGKDETSQAASVLGKKGGEAAAKARAAALKAKAGAKDPKGPSVDLDEAALKDAKDRADAKAEKEAKGANAGEDEAPAGDGEEGKGKPLGKPRRDPEARIGVLAREKNELRAKLEETQRQLAETRRAPASTREQPAERHESARDGASEQVPKLADFLAKHQGDEATAIEEYTSAVVEHKTQAVLQRQARASAEAEHSRAERERNSAFMERVAGVKPDHATFKARYDEFMGTMSDSMRDLEPTPSVLRRGGRPGPLNVVADEIIASKNAPALMEHLSDNPDELQRIATLQTPNAIVREMARLDERLDAATADTSSRREVSRAGTPPRSVGGSPHAAEPDFSSEQSFEAHMAKKRRVQK